MSDKATPRPWRYKESRNSDCQGQYHAVFGPVHPTDGGDYAPLARLSNPDNAALIVKAVNEYDALCAVVEAAIQEHGVDGINYNEECPICGAIKSLADIRAKGIA